MSVVINGFQRWRPPTVQPLTPWERALQGDPRAVNVSNPTLSTANMKVAGDTGGGESTLGPWSDNTTRLGGGNPLAGYDDNTRRPLTGAQGTFGTTYADPGGGWNPWSLYDGREGFDGTAVDGWYNAQADRPNWDINGKPQNDRDRVWGWVFEATGGNPGGTDPATLKRIFLDSVARLKRDYMAPENRARGLNWANSAFAGYDRMPGTQGGAAGTSGPAPGRGGQPGSVVSTGGGQQGGTGVADINGGGGGASGPRVGPGTYNTGTGQVTGTQTSGRGGSPFGQMTGVDPTYAFNAAAANPDIAAHYLRLAAGQKGPVTGVLGQFRDNLYGKALQAFLALNGVGGGQSGPQDMQSFLAALSGGGGGIEALLNGAASRAGGADLSGQQDVDVEKILRAALALRSVNMGSLGSTLAGNSLDNLLYEQQGLGLEDNGGASQIGGGLARGLQGGGYGQALRNFLGAGGR